MKLLVQVRNSFWSALPTLAGSIFATTLLIACGSDNNASAPVAATANKQPVKNEASSDDPTAKMARAVVIGKSNASVDLKYDILNLPIVGQPVDIDLAVIPNVAADSMSMTFVGSPGLTLTKDSAPNVDVVKAGVISHAKLAAKADKEDVFYVTVTVTLYTAGTSSARTFGIPIIVSTSAPAAAAPAPVVPANPPKKK